MRQRSQKLEEIKIDEPCSADWNQMEGSQGRRYCDQCDLHVQDLSVMPRAKAEAVLNQREQGEKLCVRVEYLPGGECVTAETPASVRSGLGRLAAAALALGASLAACNSSEPAECKGEEMIEDSGGFVQGETILLGSTISNYEPQEESTLHTLGRIRIITEESPNELVGEVCPEEELRPTLGDVCPPQVVLGSPRPDSPEREQ